MANQTVTIYGSASAYTSDNTPNKADTTKKTIAVGGQSWEGPYVQGYEKFVAPASIRGKRAVSAVLHVYARRKQLSFIETVAGNDIYSIAHDWDPSKTTDNNSPSVSDGIDIDDLGSSFAWHEYTMNTSKFAMAAKMASFGVLFHNYFEYYTSNSNYKPYIVVTVQDNGGGLQPTLVSPKNGVFKDKRNGVTVQWNNSAIQGTIEPDAQTKAVITWSYDNTTKTETINGTATTYTIPAANLPNTGTVTWKVAVTDSAGNTKTSTTATFITTDTTCYAYPSSPVNEYIDGSKAVTFAWTRSISTGSAANGADFQVSTNNGISWQDLGHTTGSASYTAAANTLPAGNVLWRVRGYNSNDTAGPWSDPAAIVVRRAPDTPLITEVTTVPQPTVSWQVEGQQAYQLQVGGWDSGTVYGTEKSAQVPYALPNGTAQVRLRIQNSFGLWSDWATAEVTIANQPGEPITAKTRVVLGGVRLTWATEGDYPTYAILRDGKEIATVAEKEYTDYTGIGRSRYTIRGLNADSTYTDSPPVVEILRPRSGLLAREGVWDWMLLDRRVDARPAHSGSQEEDAAFTWFSGRTLPVAEISGHRQVTARYEYTLPSLAQLEKLREMSGKIVVYKHRDGELIRGLLGGLSWSRNRGRWDVSFTITEVDDGPVF